METLGSAAGVFAAVSIADKLACRTKQLFEFWSAVSEAPNNIRALASGLNPLLTILTQISNDCHKHGQDETVTEILEQCVSQVAILMRITETLDMGFASGSKRQRKWSAIKAVFKEDEIATFKNELTDLKSTLTLAQGHMLSRSSNAHFEDQKISTTQLIASVKNLEIEESSKMIQISDEEKAACIRAFYVSDSASKLDSVPAREPGTCEWVTNHRKYRAWDTSQTSELLWLSGIPGCGKTVISSFIIESLRSRSDAITIYFMCDNKLENFRNKEDLLRSVLHQLMTLDSSLVQHAIVDYKNKGESVADSSNTMWNILVKMLKDKHRSRPIYFVLDALDECVDDSREWILRKLGELFVLGDNGTQNTFDSSSVFKVIVTSRPWEDIEFGFQSITQIRLKTEVEEGIQEDIDVYIKRQVQMLAKRCRHTTAQQTLITDVLRSKANGMFLWVSLIVKGLLRTPANNIERHLKNLPATLYQVYDDILSKIEESNVERIRLILMWVVTARRPLNLEELALACELPGLDCANPTNLQDLVGSLKWDIGLCGPILIIRYRFVQLVHQSAKDYLLDKKRYIQLQTGPANLQFDLIYSHSKVTQLCLDYLSCKEFQIAVFTEDEKVDFRRGRKLWAGDEAMNKHLKNYPLLSYCATYWPAHFQGSGYDPSSTERVALFFKQSELVTGWFGFFCFSDRGFKHMTYVTSTALHIAIYLGLDMIVQSLIEDPATKLNAQDSDSLTPLWVAVVGQCFYEFYSESTAINVIRRLASAGADLDLKNGGIMQTPLHLAAADGGPQMVAVLLHAGASVNVKDIYGWTPLHLTSSRNDSCSSEIAQALIDLRAAVGARTDEQFTPLLCVLKNHEKKDPDIVRALLAVLLRSGADINHEILGETLLSHGSRWSQPIEGKILYFLLEHGAKFTSTPGNTDTTTYLYNAVVRKDHKAIDLLLKAGADIDFSSSGASPLQIAIAAGEEDVVKSFLMHRKHSNSSSDARKICLTRLHRAALDGKAVPANEIIALDTVLDFEQEDSCGMTILVQAVKGGNLLIVKTLLDTIKKIIQGHRVNTILYEALWLAASIDAPATAVLLLESGAPVELHHEELGVVRLKPFQETWLDMQKLGLGINKGNWRPLHVAATSGSTSIAKYLLENGANNDAGFSDMGCLTAIHLAAIKGHLDVVELLLGYNAKVHPCTLGEVCARSDESLIHLLLKNGVVDINAKCLSHRYLTPICCAAERGSVKGVKALLQEGANLNLTDRFGQTPLHVAAESGHDLVLSVLIQQGANINAIDDKEASSLFNAANSGHFKSVKTLLEAGASLHIPNNSKKTPLHVAAGEGDENIVKLLLEHGADCKRVDDTGETPLMKAMKKRHLVVVGMLKEWEEEHPSE